MKKKEFLNNFLKVVEITTAYYLGYGAADKYFSGAFWQEIGLTALIFAVFCGVEKLVRSAVKHVHPPEAQEK